MTFRRTLCPHCRGSIMGTVTVGSDRRSRLLMRPPSVTGVPTGRQKSAFLFYPDRTRTMVGGRNWGRSG